MISVIVWQFQPRGYLKEAVTSVLTDARGETDVEVIVALGQSDPASESWLASAPPEVRVLPNREHVLGRMMESACRATTGDVVVFLDDDDRFKPGKIGHVARLFDADPTLAFYHHEADLIGPDGAPAVAPWFHSATRAHMQPGRCVYLPAHSKLERLGRLAFTGVDFNSSCMAVRRAALEPFFSEMGEIEAGNDAFLFFTGGVLSSGAIRCDGQRWTEYRLSGRGELAPSMRADPRAALHAASLRYSVAEQKLVELTVSRGRPEARTTAEAIVGCHRFFAELRSPQPSRGGWARSWVSLVRLWRTFPVRTNWTALAGSLAWMVSPRAAQRVYLDRILGP